MDRCASYWQQLIRERKITDKGRYPFEQAHRQVIRYFFLSVRRGVGGGGFFDVFCFGRFRRAQAPEDEARDILCGVILSHVPVVRRQRWRWLLHSPRPAPVAAFCASYGSHFVSRKPITIRIRTWLALLATCLLSCLPACLPTLPAPVPAKTAHDHAFGSEQQ